MIVSAFFRRLSPHGGLERRIQVAAFGLAMLLVFLLGLVTLVVEAIRAKEEWQAQHQTTLRIQATHIGASLARRADTLAELSNSPLIWTAISDSMGRDAYLRPYLSSLNMTDGAGMLVSLYNYRGLWISGDRTPPGGSHEVVRTLTEQVKATLQPAAYLDARKSPRLILAFPVRYPYTSEVVGVLIGNLALDHVVDQPLGNLGNQFGYQVSLNEVPLFAAPGPGGKRHQEVSEVVAHPKYPTLYRLEIQLYGTQSHWVALAGELGAVYLATALLLSLAIWQMAGLLARRLSGRLNRLADAVSGSERPRAEDIPADIEGDEISRLGEALKGALADHARITEQLERLVAERTRELSISQERYQLAIQGSRDGIWDWVLATGKTYYSARWKAMIGYAEDELEDTYATFQDHLHPDDKDRVLAALEQHLKGNTGIFEAEFRFRHKDGSWRWVLTRGAALRDEQGRPYRMAGSHTDITERKALEAAHNEAFNRLQKIAARLPGMVYQYRMRPDQSACFPFASEAIREIYRVSPEEVREDAGKVFAIFHPDDYDDIVASIRTSAADLTLWRHEYRVKYDDGTIRWLLGNAVPEREEDGATLWHGFITDITERKQAEAQLQLAAAVFTHAREGISITDAKADIVDVNETFTRITGYSREEVIGRNSRILSSGQHDPEFYLDMWRNLTEKGYWQGEIWNRRKSGELYAETLAISAVRDAQGRTQHYVGLFSDITALKQHQLQLEHIAHFDALTSLPNRVLLADRLSQGMTQALRHGQHLAVAFLDLDGFKAINDNYGHEMGDRLLMTVATRLKHLMREGDTVARIGGDEFVAVILDLVDIEDCVPLLTRLLNAIAQPVQAGELTLQVSASLGITFYPQAEEVDADQLLRQADQAMYQAKLAGKNRYHVFDSEQDRSVRGHHESLEHIQHALVEKQFGLYYQPKVNMRTGKVIGVEALLRWLHPERGPLLPEVFLPVIESHPLAVELGEWVIETVLVQMERWLDAGLDLAVSFNVGARQLQQADFIDRLREILAGHPRIKPRQLELEVLETSALEDLAKVSNVIKVCRDMGLRFALDDFGTGYSSLTYLKQLPADTLKIDQSFIRDMLVDPDDLAILEGVLGLAIAFRRQAIAEGVETVQHGIMLLQLGCELAQGYAIARPMAPEALPDWLATWRPEPAWVGQSAISRVNLPVLYAAIEHRAWVAGIENHLLGERAAPPQLDHHQCRFGAWLDSDAEASHFGRPELNMIEILHREAHERGRELLVMAASGHHAEALAGMADLRRLRDHLLDKLQALME